MPNPKINPRLAALYERLARYGAYLVATLGVIVLIGWGLDISALKSIVPGWGTMKANTALCFTLSGIALSILCRAQMTAGWCRGSLAMSAGVFAIGLLTLVEYVLDNDLGIDQLLFSDIPDAQAGFVPGRMAPATTVGFVVTGLALACLNLRRTFVISQAAPLIGILIGFLAVLGYAYDVSVLYGIGAYSAVALPTALAFLIINAAILLSRPRRGLCGMLSSNTAGGMMMRRLLPLAFIAPFTIGWVLVINEDSGWVSPRFALALASLIYLAIFLTVFWRTAGFLHHIDLVRMIAQDERRKQQAELAGIIDSAMDGIIMVDDAQRITLFNPAAEKMFGRCAADVLGMSLVILMPSRFRERHGVDFRAFGATGETNRRMGRLGTVIGLRANDDEFPVEASISQLKTDGTRLSTVILRDISDRVRFEQALLDSRRQLSAMIEQAPVSIAQFDRDMCYLATSRLWVAIYGGGIENLRGMNHYDVVHDISDAWKKVHRDGMAGITTTCDSDLWIKADGSRQWLRWAVHPWIDEGGRIGGIIISAEDITRYKLTELALRASEDDLNRAQAFGGIGSWRLDMQSKELTWSSENYRIFGLPEGTHLTYESFLERVHPDDRVFVEHAWVAAVSGAPYDIEHRILVGSEVKWVRAKAELEFDREGRLLSGFGITQDITAQRRADDQIREANARLAAVAAERSASLLVLSTALTNAEERERDRLYELLHDHVQPLLVASRLALSGLGEETSREDVLRVVGDAKEHISRVLQTARTLSIELNPPLIRERGLIPALQSLGHWVEKNYGISVDLDCSEGLEPGNLTVRLLCFKGVRELLLNVVKYAGTKHVEIQLEVINRETLRITVRDNGAGFDPANCQPGSGLPVIEQRLGMVGGSLSIKSAPGMGTCVSLQVPLDLPEKPRIAYRVRRRSCLAYRRPARLSNNGSRLKSELN